MLYIIVSDVYILWDWASMIYKLYYDFFIFPMSQMWLSGLNKQIKLVQSPWYAHLSSKTNIQFCLLFYRDVKFNLSH